MKTIASQRIEEKMMPIKCKSCKKGVLFSVPCSKLEESLGHQVFECDGCHQRWKLLTDGTIADQQVEVVRTYERFIAVGMGYWGAGATVEEAKNNLRRAGGKLKEGFMLWKFTSKLPFAPSTKKVADETEADCWVGQDGSMSWVRCEREEVV